MSRVKWCLLLVALTPTASSMAQTPIVNWTSDTTGWTRLTELSVNALPCLKVSQDFDVTVPSPNLLDPQQTTSAVPGLELYVVNSLGTTDAQVISLQTGVAKIRMTAEGLGTVVEKPCTLPGQQQGVCKGCIGATEAFTIVHVIAHYRIQNASAMPSLEAAFQPASAPPAPTVALPTFGAFAPQLRMALSLRPFQAALASFGNVEYGDTIRLGEFGCGDPRFSVRFTSAPTFTAEGWLGSTPNALFASQGTTLRASVGAKAQIHENCFGNNPEVGASASFAVPISSPTAQSKVNLNGTAWINALSGLLNLRFGVNVEMPLPASVPLSIPIDLQPVPDAILDFGSFSGGVWSSTGAHKDIPVAVRLGSFGGPVANNSTLVIDAAIGSGMPIKAFSSYSAAKQYFESDVPLWNSRTVGVTLREELFGTAKPGTAPIGLLGHVLPIRVKGVAKGKVLWLFPVKKDFEVVLDIAKVTMPQDIGADPSKAAIHIELGSTYARIANSKPQISNDTPIRAVTGSITFDNIRYEKDAVRFRVADFRLLIRTTHFLIPVRLPSAALERALNRGNIPLTGPPEVSFGLPRCLYTGYEKFKSPKGVCAPEQLIGYLGAHDVGLTLVLDPTTLQIRPASATVESHTWRGIQTSVTVSPR